MVTEVPTCQKMLVELPFRNAIIEPGAVVRVVPIWKWNAAFARHIPGNGGRASIGNC